MSKIEIKIYDSEGNQTLSVVIEGKGFARLMETLSGIGQSLIFKEFFPKVTGDGV